MTLMNNMIRFGKFKEFCVEFIRLRNEETEETTLWEFYLHKVFDKTFTEFKEAVSVRRQTVSNEDLKDTISGSLNMLEGFKIE